MSPGTVIVMMAWQPGDGIFEASEDMKENMVL